jgi:hypothetical protein
MTLQQITEALRSTGWVLVTENQWSLGETWLVKLDPAGVNPQGPADGAVVGSFQLFMAGEDDAIDDGTFEEFAVMVSDADWG